MRRILTVLVAATPEMLVGVARRLVPHDAIPPACSKKGIVSATDSRIVQRHTICSLHAGEGHLYRMGSPCSCATGSRSGRRGAAPPGSPTRAGRAPACSPAARGSGSTARRPPPWPASARAAGTCCQTTPIAHQSSSPPHKKPLAITANCSP